MKWLLLTKMLGAYIIAAAMIIKGYDTDATTILKDNKELTDQYLGA